MIYATRRTTQGKAARHSLKNYNLRCLGAARATRRRAKLRAAGGLQATEMNWKDFAKLTSGSLASEWIMNEVACRTRKAAAAKARAICKKHDKLF